MNLAIDLPVLNERLTELNEALNGKRPTPAALKVWGQTLREFPLPDIVDVLTGWAKRATKPPAPAEVYKVLNERRADRIEQSADNDKARFAADAQALHRRDPIFAAKLHALTADLTASDRPKKDPKAWASTIYNNFLADRPNPNGSPVSYIQIDFACQALRINVNDACALRERVREQAA